MNKLIIKSLNKSRRFFSGKNPSPSSSGSVFFRDSSGSSIIPGSKNYEEINHQCDYQGQNASDYLKTILSKNQPCMISRFGDLEFAALLTYLNIAENQSFLSKSINYITGKSGCFWWDDKLIQLIADTTGFFPTNESSLQQLCELYLKDIKNIDVLGSWLVDDKQIKQTFFPNAKTVRLEDLEPYYHQNPWSEILKEKTVLVIHPFEESIKSQYENRSLLFQDTRILPCFELKTLKAVQSIGNTDGQFSTWFEALDYMCEQITNIEFDVAIIGAGAYGLPLASFVKKLGKKSIHLGGATQILFGIKGHRWEQRLFFQKLFNEHWVYPLAVERPKAFQKADSGAYW